MNCQQNRDEYKREFFNSKNIITLNDLNVIDRLKLAEFISELGINSREDKMAHLNPFSVIFEDEDNDSINSAIKISYLGNMFNDFYDKNLIEKSYINIDKYNNKDDFDNLSIYYSKMIVLIRDLFENDIIDSSKFDIKDYLSIFEKTKKMLVKDMCDCVYWICKGEGIKIGSVAKLKEIFNFYLSYITYGQFQYLILSAIQSSIDYIESIGGSKEVSGGLVISTILSFCERTVNNIINIYPGKKIEMYRPSIIDICINLLGIDNEDVNNFLFTRKKVVDLLQNKTSINFNELTSSSDIASISLLNRINRLCSVGLNKPTIKGQRKTISKKINLNGLDCNEINNNAVISIK